MDSLQCKDVLEVYKEAKFDKYTKPTIEEFKNKLRERIIKNSPSISFNEDSFSSICVKLHRRCNYHLDKVVRKKRSFDETETWLHLDDILHGTVNTNSVNTKAENVEPCGAKYRKTLSELGKRQQYRRTDEIISLIQAVANENRVTVNCLLGHVLKRLNYHSNNKIATVGAAMIQSENSSEQADAQLSLPVASFIQLNNDMGRSKYQNLSNTLKDNGHSILPPWKTLRKYQLELTPAVEVLEKPVFGVQVDYVSALRRTIERTLEVTKPESLPPTNSVLIANFKDGLDGSGSHPIYNQLDNAHTHNIIMYMFCQLSLTKENGEEVWREHSPNSPRAMRPLFLLLGKECRENVECVSQIVNDRSQLKSEPMEIHVHGRYYKVQVSCSMSMIDGKMRSLLSGLGGAYCSLCTMTKEEASGMSDKGIEVITEGMEIDRNVDDTVRIWEEQSETTEDGGRKIKRRIGDYQVRKGVTNEPLVKEDISFVSPLHALLRTFDFCMKLINFLRAGIFKWSESKIALGQSYESLIKARSEVQKQIKMATGILVDAPDATGHGGSSTTGNVCRSLLENHRDVLCSLVPASFQAPMHEVLLRIWVILKIYSSNYEVCVDEFSAFCIDTYVMIISEFKNPTGKSWIHISPTLHALLAHSGELISANDGKGLKDKSEEGVEHCNKFLRFYRRALARKCSQVTNLKDCYSRLWLQSDPGIRYACPPRPCCRCKSLLHRTVSCPDKETVTVAPERKADIYMQQLLY